MLYIIKVKKLMPYGINFLFSIDLQLFDYRTLVLMTQLQLNGSVPAATSAMK
jgi:hypothetical protein